MLKPPRCGDRLHAPYLGGDCQAVLLTRLGEASPTCQGTVSKFHPASSWERHPSSSPAGANLGPAPRLLRPAAGEAGRDYPIQRPRLRLRDLGQEPSANYHRKRTRLLVPEALGLGCCLACYSLCLPTALTPPQAGHRGLFLTQLPNPAGLSIKTKHNIKTHNPTQVAALRPTQGRLLAPAQWLAPSCASFLPSKGKIPKLATAPLRKSKGVGWVILSLLWGPALQVFSFIKVLATLLERASLEVGACLNPHRSV
ncbi:hypothetical protein HJG60_007799 [Phyllostomus discolor]|uniref:Uncharacterized protein n=1 Tax=Phyllostomus discolor TaxID=89673 RepID=A0A834EVH0_9CHIR|nr:hypothetical protein HJG60_007799 [Phyllostomus discolor]